MKTTVDSSVLWSIFKGEDDSGAWLDLLGSCAGDGSLIAFEIVVAEVSPLFDTQEALLEAFADLEIEIVPSRMPAWRLAGKIFQRYRSNRGPREHLIPDFLIAAHARLQGNQLAAQDRGYVRRYFSELRLVQPRALSDQ